MTTELTNARGCDAMPVSQWTEHVLFYHSFH